MMKNFRKTELGLLFGYFILLITQMLGKDVSTGLIGLLIALDLLWIVVLFRPGGKRQPGFTVGNLLEKLLISILLWGITMNLSVIPRSSMTIKFGLFLLSVYYLISGIVKLFRKDHRMNGFERILASMVFTGFLFAFFHWPGANVFRVFSLGILSITFFVYGVVLAFSFSRDKNPGFGVLMLGTYWSLSFWVSFILFDAMYWPGTVMLFYSGFVFVILFAAILFVKQAFSSGTLLNPSNRTVLSDTWRRILIYTCISVFFYVLSIKQVIQLKYGNYPRLIEAEYNCRIQSKGQMDSEDCENYKQIYELYRQGKLREESKP